MPHIDVRPDAGPRFAFHVREAEPAHPSSARARLQLEPEKIERGLLKLVLSLIELIRQLMEKQAMRRIEGGSLTPEEIDRLGRGLMAAESTIRMLQAQFGIDDLNLDLGPIGSLLSDHR